MKNLLTKTAVLVSMLTVISVNAGNLFQNSSFEEISPKNNFPMFWDKSPAYKGDISLITDALEAYRGSTAVKIRSVKGDAAILYTKGVRLGSEREVTMTLWAKGSGKFTIFFY